MLFTTLSAVVVLAAFEAHAQAIITTSRAATAVPVTTVTPTYITVSSCLAVATSYPNGPSPSGIVSVIGTPSIGTAPAGTASPSGPLSAFSSVPAGAVIVGNPTLHARQQVITSSVIASPVATVSSYIGGDGTLTFSVTEPVGTTTASLLSSAPVPSVYLTAIDTVYATVTYAGDGATTAIGALPTGLPLCSDLAAGDWNAPNIPADIVKALKQEGGASSSTVSRVGLLLTSIVGAAFCF